MTPYLQLLRIRQWIKNIFVVAPLIFSSQFSDPFAIFNTVITVFLFCLASSLAYVFNDLVDIEQDRSHPQKSKNRPLANGTIKPKGAIRLLIALALILILSAFLFNPSVLAVISLYVILTVAYSLYLKHQPIVDIFIIASGFVLRIYAGAVAIFVPLSGWMFITSFTLALYLAAVKRRQELLLGHQRPVLKLYSETLIQRYAEMSATGALVFYSLFVMTEKPQLIITIPLVLFGLFRYWYVVETHNAGESPADVLFKDALLGLTVLIWGALCLFILWP